jgi:hypothetical protein
MTGPAVGPGLALDHIGFLTEDVEAEMANFSLMFPGTLWSPRFVDETQDVTARFGRTPQGLVYELIHPNSPASPIAAALRARKNLLNHICYRCEDLAAKAAELRAQGLFPVTEPRPGIAFGNEPIQFFFHSNGLLLELVQGLHGPFDGQASMAFRG